MTALDRLQELRGEVREAEKRLASLELERQQSGRWLDAAKAKLVEYHVAVDQGRRKANAVQERKLRDTVAELEGTRVSVGTRGSTTIYADARVVRRCQDADDAVQAAKFAVVEFIRDERVDLQAEMLARAEAARDGLLDGLRAASQAFGDWAGVRGEWVELLQWWGGSPAELPRLPIDDPTTLFEQARAHAERYDGIPRTDAQLVPAPASLTGGERRADDGASMRAATADDLFARNVREVA